jgi:putative tryptophan/tyrosine transport system substrate-binding protein
MPHRAPPAPPLTRRAFVAGAGAAGVGLLAGCGRLPWQAAPPRVPRIGYVGVLSPAGPDEVAFLEGLRDLGYQEGVNVTIDWRFADGREEELPRLVADLLAAPVDLIVASGPSATLAVKQATDAVPIVMCFGGDPFEHGLISSLARPGGNVTGLSALTSELNAKRLELMTEAVPGLARVAVLWDLTAGPADTVGPADRGRLEDAARTLQLELRFFEVAGPSELARAVEAAVADRAGGLYVATSSLFTAQRQRIVDAALRSRLPVVAARKPFAEAGGLLTYAADFPSMYRRAAGHVDKILHGAKPAELPVEQPTTFDLVVNMKTARAFGISFPPEILLQVTEAIE